jgi:hypothetical protein
MEQGHVPWDTGRKKGGTYVYQVYEIGTRLFVSSCILARWYMKKEIAEKGKVDGSWTSGGAYSA